MGVMQCGCINDIPAVFEPSPTLEFKSSGYELLSIARITQCNLSNPFFSNDARSLFEFQTDTIWEHIQ